MKKLVLLSAFACIICTPSSAQKQEPQAIKMPDLSGFVKQNDLKDTKQEITSVRQEASKLEQEIKNVKAQNKRLEDARSDDNRTMINYVDGETKKVTNDIRAMEERITRRLETLNTKVEALEKMMIKIESKIQQHDTKFKEARFGFGFK